MSPNARLMQRLAVDASKTAKQQPAHERQAAPKPREEKPEQMQHKPEGLQRKPTLVMPGVKYTNAPDNRPAPVQRAQEPKAEVKAQPSPLQSAQAAGRPAERLNTRLAAPAQSQPAQARPGPSAQRQQQVQSRPADRLTVRLAAGGTEKVTAAIQQQQQRGPTPGRGM